MKKIGKLILAGGTGQIGTVLSNYFADKVEEIIILSRRAQPSHRNIKYLKWDGKTAGQWSKELDGAEILVNLAGKNVNCRYTEKNKREIFDSRTNSIHALTDAINECSQAPALWIQFASATIYRHAEDRPMTEEDGEIGEGFSVEVCKLWEKTFWEDSAALVDTRKVVLRTSLVLSKNEGVYPRLRNLVRFGLGGKQGNGRQWVSWIHELDLARMVEWISMHPETDGVFNCTAQKPLHNKEFMKVLRNSLGIPIGLPAPAWLLELGAKIIGTETELILKSRWVLPTRIKKTGFQFVYPGLEEAAEALHSGA